MSCMILTRTGSTALTGERKLVCLVMKKGVVIGVLALAVGVGVAAVRGDVLETHSDKPPSDLWIEDDDGPIVAQLM